MLRAGSRSCMWCILPQSIDCHQNCPEAAGQILESDVQYRSHMLSAAYFATPRQCAPEQIDSVKHSCGANLSYSTHLPSRVAAGTETDTDSRPVKKCQKIRLPFS